MIVDSEVLFCRLLAVSDEERCFTWASAQPWTCCCTPSLFFDDGSMRKNTKSDLAKKMETNVDEIYEIEDSDKNKAYVFDGMSMLQGMSDKYFKTFDDLGNQVKEKCNNLLKS